MKVQFMFKNGKTKTIKIKGEVNFNFEDTTKYVLIEDKYIINNQEIVFIKVK